jgi:[ribosomal protein S18]-alanine N-acetyltransferase
MTAEAASQIAAWHYVAPYDVYDVSADGPTVLLDGDHVAVLDDDEVVGFVCFGAAARVPGGPTGGDGVVDVGIGIRPDVLSDRLGTRAGELALETLRMAGHGRLRASVMEWNERSIRLALRLGFTATTSFADERDGRRFTVLERELLS